MATIKKYAYPNLDSFLAKVAELAAAGDFFDAVKLPRHYFGQRRFSPFPGADIKTTKTKPASSGFIDEDGDKLYKEVFPASIGQFLNDFQVAIADGKQFDKVTFSSGRLRPYAMVNVDTYLPSITAVGQTQYSANGTSGWSDTIPDGVMKAGSPVDFYIRVTPNSIEPADDGTYEYDFLMETEGAGGLTLKNLTGNKARIKGTTPADQKGKTFSVNTTVKDKLGASVTGTALTQVWA